MLRAGLTGRSFTQETIDLDGDLFRPGSKRPVVLAAGITAVVRLGIELVMDIRSAGNGGSISAGMVYGRNDVIHAGTTAGQRACHVICGKVEADV